MGRRARQAQVAGLIWLACGVVGGILLIDLTTRTLQILGVLLVIVGFPGYALYLAGRRTWTTLLESLPLFQAWEGAGGVLTIRRTSLVGETAITVYLATPGWSVQHAARLWRATERQPPRLAIDLGDEPRLGDSNVVPLGKETVAVRPMNAGDVAEAGGELWQLKRYGKDLTRASHRQTPSGRFVVIDDPGLLLPHELEAFVRALAW